MLWGIAIDHNGELGHRARARRTQIVFTKIGDGNRDGFIEGLRVYIDAMVNALRVGERDAAS